MKNIKNSRIIVVISLFILICTIFVFRLIKLQLIDGESYYDKSMNSVVTTSVVKAPRGDILDRYCKPLVQDTKTISVIVNTALTDDINETVSRTVKLFESCKEDYIDTFPITKEEPYSYIDEYNSSASSKNKFEKYLTSKKIDADNSEAEIINGLIKYYRLSEYDKSDAVKIISIRYEMELRSQKNLFTFAEDVGLETATAVKENGEKLNGVYLEVEPTRVYTTPYHASHLLGTVGRIYADEYEELKGQGYLLDDFVGKDGVEKICEQYLRGVNGEISTVRDKTGSAVNVIQKVEAQAGSDVILTIDSNLQKITESSLDELIKNCREHNGEDAASSGAAVFLDINSGEVLSMASWPTYNLETYNQDFSSLSKDESKPFVNRVISGLFPPGSTFKMVTATAGLEENIISQYSTRKCIGKYTYYPTYQPSCFNNRAHGEVNVMSALQKSCNVFFFDVGRLMGIDNLNKYGAMYGFGSKTGIELSGESRGILAGRAYRESVGKGWEDGETLLAAIGQSDNMATPLQLANYVATIANGGRKYTPHIIKSVRNRETGKIEYETAISYEELGFNENTLSTVRRGMEAVVSEGGSAYSSFRDFNISVAAKTGTSEVPNGQPTSLLVGYAPADNPQIAFALVVENGGTGTTTLNASLIKDVLSYYFSNIGSYDTVNDINNLIG